MLVKTSFQRGLLKHFIYKEKSRVSNVQGRTENLTSMI